MDSFFLLRFPREKKPTGPGFHPPERPVSELFPSIRDALSMKKISAVLLTKNEEKNVDRCLGALHWVDEIVVVDTGSTDQTLPLVRNYTETIETGDIRRGFAYNRNLGNERARNRWILKVDPDEVISEALAQEIQKVLAREAGLCSGQVHEVVRNAEGCTGCVTLSNGDRKRCKDHRHVECGISTRTRCG